MISVLCSLVCDSPPPPPALMAASGSGGGRRRTVLRSLPGGQWFRDARFSLLSLQLCLLQQFAAMGTILLQNCRVLDTVKGVLAEGRCDVLLADGKITHITSSSGGTASRPGTPTNAVASSVVALAAALAAADAPEVISCHGLTLMPGVRR